jgi:alpha/beta superfamily hydrolase
VIENRNTAPVSVKDRMNGAVCVTSRFRETHFFLEVAPGKRIYAVEYIPQGRGKECPCVILCKSIWGERIRTHRIFTNLARYLADDGMYVITCDYFGDGNSGGDTIDLSLGSMVEDLKGMIRHMSDVHNVGSFVLLGFRVGTVCVLSGMKEVPNVRKTILIEPVVNPGEFLRSALRSNLTAQMAAHKKILKNREKLIEDLKNNIPVNIDGFVIGKRFFESFDYEDAFREFGEGSIETTVVKLSEGDVRKKRVRDGIPDYPNLKVQEWDKEFYWHEWKLHTPFPVAFMNGAREEILK